ncbi:MAG: DUF87 domain-containing protein [Rhodocyclaceae bacterium]|nr:DUF87 domain-containing protein [Rhodocyclaceae bacterium]MCA3026157.1 DUF87 domain-containing protein [Rhodocyclaceae bacterium]MCA3031572.1 DUF87 domain-containing protein [Rhodocyclaceae bacterium]MCA3035989.1 DUF87 domain-containing protein [Rhodocyclaceae bacterium]MCA3040495.1 DUF87 domain-containing protein [Rhodocyclaceae bacterium]
MARSTIPQGLRYTFMLVELGALLCANRVAFGAWLPTSDPSSLWFYAALFGLLLGQRLDTPFFTAPKDAALYAIPAFFALLQISDDAWLKNEKFGEVAHTLMAAWILLVLAASSAAVWFQGSTIAFANKVGGVAMQLSGALGNPQAFFSVILFLVVLAFPPAAVEGILIIVFAWSITVPFSILDYVYRFWQRVWLIATSGKDVVSLAEVVHFHDPGLLLLRLGRRDAMPANSVFVFRLDTGEKRIGLATGFVGRDGGWLLRAVDLGEAEKSQVFEGLKWAAPMKVLPVDANQLTAAQRQTITEFRSACVGFVAPETDIGRLVVELKDDLTALKRETDSLGALYAGRLLVVAGGSGVEVVYQLTNGLTKEEIVFQKNSYGFVLAHARAVGIWDAERARFKASTWVASPNAPVRLLLNDQLGFDRAQLGTFPGTGFAVRVERLDHLVTHNTAILGILGVGKSTLAMELIERAISTECKAIVLDLTNQYLSDMAPLIDLPYNIGVNEALRTAGAAGKTNVKLNVEEGGSRALFASAAEEQINAFMMSSHKLLVLNPSDFDVWKQDSRPFNGTASMASLTACEITYLVSDAALKVVQGMGRTDSARLWLVYEEAHSLVPEWNATVAEGDRAASNGSSRAILQGRKYGLGCLLIAQRTASVTKTILNQCNSIFAMRSFDDTGKEFLSNYIGKDYAALLSTLPERNAIIFGRASSCENPVQIRLNDRDDFVVGFRQKSTEKAALAD